MAIQTTNQAPASQRKTYTDEFRNNALQELKSGRSLPTVALELGIAAATLLRWKRQAEGVVAPTKEHFDHEFKARALQKLDKGQRLQQVASAMGVSIASLVQWKRQRQIIDQGDISTFAETEVIHKSHYTDRLHEVAHQVLDTGQPLDMITPTSGVASITIPLGKNQVAAQDFLAITALDYTEDDKEKVLTLLKAGQSIKQVSVLLNVPTVLVRRWWLHRGAAGDTSKIDGRRLYDDAFKAEALRQIHQGVSVRQLAKSIGVTQVTLHKWRKASTLMTEAREADTPLKADMPVESADSSEVGSEESSHERIARLEQQLWRVEQERDTLKKAIQILMRVS